MIFFNNVSSDDMGVVVEYCPNLNRPAKKYEKVSVPGRNGDLYFGEGAFENYTQEYDIHFHSHLRGHIAERARRVMAWLYAPNGYARLEDGYDLDVFRLAHFSDETEVENLLLKYGRATISFDCKPQRFLKIGETAINLDDPTSIINPTAFTALPLIRVNGSGAGELAIGNYSVTFSAIDEFVYLDSELQDAYKGDVNKNNTISSEDFPKLIGGENAVSWSGGITSVTIIPRWWTI